MSKISVVTPVKADGQIKVQWLIEAIQSVKAQTFKDWEMIIVNDRSSVKFSDFPDLVAEMKDDRITGMKTKQPGVSSARNTGVEAATGPLLLPMDADDLLPEDSMQVLAEEWNKQPEGIVYGHTKILQNDSQRVFRAKPYAFKILLQSLIMPVGSLHQKSDWEKVGGWKPEMDQGLEDWEYWIALGEAGVCGRPVKALTYVYRRHPHSRLSWIRSKGIFEKAQQKIRELHQDVYAGRSPVGCCGGGARPTPKKQAMRQMSDRRIVEQEAAIQAIPQEGLVDVIYVGDMAGSWGVNGKVTGIHYDVLGPGLGLRMPDGRMGVDSKDVHFILSLYRGHAFKIKGRG